MSCLVGVPASGSIAGRQKTAIGNFGDDSLTLPQKI